MRQEDFLRELEKLLSDIPQEEREEALAFYRSYFEDAGEENEEKILQELESPEKVAESIKSGCQDADTETGSRDADPRETDSQNGSESQSGDVTDLSSNEKQSFYDKNKTLSIIIIIAAVILLAPVWTSALGVLAGIVFGGLGIVFGLVVALGAIAFALCVAGVSVFAAGIGCLVTGSIIAGILCLGIGLLLFAIGVLSALAEVLFCGKLIPAVVKLAGELWNKVFHRKGATA